MIIALLIILYLVGILAGLVMNKCYGRSPTYNASLDWAQSLFPIPQVFWPISLCVALISYVVWGFWIKGVDPLIELIADKVCPNLHKED